MVKFLDVTTNAAYDNMHIDSMLLDELTADGEPILRFYEWGNRALSYGYFIECEKFIDTILAKERKIDLVRRPTGGGIVFHASDLTFSFFMPRGHKFFSNNVLENYQFVNNHILMAVKELFNLQEEVLLKNDLSSMKGGMANFCMVKPTKYDLMFNGKKIAGAAQRTKKNGYLHQASIFLAPIEEEVLQIARFNTDDLKKSASFLLPDSSDIASVRASLFSLLHKHFCSTFGS
jgi:lipoate-protein ligase A